MPQFQPYLLKIVMMLLFVEPLPCSINEQIVVQQNIESYNDLETNQYNKELEIFHNDSENVFPTRFVTDIPLTGCKSYAGETLCLEVNNYPEFNKSIQNELSKYREYFKIDLAEPDTVIPRYGMNTVKLCESTTQTIFPQAGFSSGSGWVTIVQDGNQYRQAVRVETCMYMNRPCEVVNRFMANRYSSFCAQSFIYQTLVAFNGRPYMDSIQIPSCCKCNIRFG